MHFHDRGKVYRPKLYYQPPPSLYSLGTCRLVKASPVRAGLVCHLLPSDRMVGTISDEVSKTLGTGLTQGSFVVYVLGEKNIL